MSRRSLFLLAPAVLLLAVLGAQPPVKRPLTHLDYDGWRSIQSPQLSRDGRFLAYALFPQEGDGEVVVRELATGKEHRQSAGALPPPPETEDPEAEPGQGPPRRSIRLAFTHDGRFLVSATYPSKADTDKAKKERKRPEEMPKGGLLIMDVATGAASRIADVKSFQVPERGESLLAYLKEGKPAEKPAPKEGEARPPARSRPRTEYGTELALRPLARPEAERTFEDVLEYALSRDGKTLVYAVSSRKPETNGVYAAATSGEAPPAALLSGRGKYARLTWDRRQARLAFLSDRDDAASKPPKMRLYVWERGAAAAVEVVSTATAGFHAGWVISDRGNVSFSRDGGRLVFGCAPERPPERDAEAAPAEGRVAVDLWHWRDDYIQPMQKVRATRERNRTYPAVFHLAEKKLVQLAGPEMQTIIASDDARWAIGADDRPYRRMVDYDGNYADYYLVDTVTGARKRLLERQRAGGPSGGAVQWSPDSRHVLFYRDKHWHSARVPDGGLTNLTATLGVNFFNEEDDHPAPPGSYGAAGWTRDGRFVLLNDRFDVWQVAADATTAANVTDRVGRRERLQFRVVRLEREEDEEEPRGIDASQPLLLRAESLETRDTGFWRDRLGAAAPPEKLLMAAKNFRALSKAREADVVLVTASTFNEFPDLQVTDSSFRALRKVSDANPQKAQLRWGTGELVRFKSADGVPLQAALFKPEDFDPRRKYPMLVYIYERLSQGVHHFVDPRPQHSINAAYYVSNGYLVLMPDIVYTVGSPGHSALKCVLPAVQAVVDRGFVDENAIGLQGHSWGGYQTAYLLTQTRRFRAAEAGAPVGNMTSAYNGIRWGSGLPRQFQYETGQSRLGVSLAENPLRFIENSPVFMAGRIETPLLILHDDQDDAVPWYQGIELFLSLRRLGKEVYLFNYNGEKHGLRQRPNQKDYAVRMQQFFDHFLKGAPRPAWMEKGIPYLER